MRATARAHPNLALIKYWGKRDGALNLPFTGSLSMTLDGLSTRTSVEFLNEPLGDPRGPAGTGDTATLNGAPLEGAKLARVSALLALVRVQSARAAKRRARVVSQNDFPAGAGLASSAAGGAALAAAAAWAAGLAPTPTELSILARRYSGSACRSLHGGFVEWVRGERADGSDSHGILVAPSTHWPELRMVALICSEEEKALSSRDGMRRTVESSPFYNGWVEAAAADLEKARAALLARDLERLGAAMERNAFRMHASAMGAVPPVLYMRAATLAAYEAVLELRRRGTGAWFTLDAGPNPLFLCLASDAERVAEVAGEAAGARRRIFCTVGGAVERLAEEGR